MHKFHLDSFGLHQLWSSSVWILSCNISQIWKWNYLIKSPTFSLRRNHCSLLANIINIQSRLEFPFCHPLVAYPANVHIFYLVNSWITACFLLVVLLYWGKSNCLYGNWGNGRVIRHVLMSCVCVFARERGHMFVFLSWRGSNLRQTRQTVEKWSCGSRWSYFSLKNTIRHTNVYLYECCFLLFLWIHHTFTFLTGWQNLSYDYFGY